VVSSIGVLLLQAASSSSRSLTNCTASANAEVAETEGAFDEAHLTANIADDAEDC
jgi:hypothetical protein